MPGPLAKNRTTRLAAPNSPPRKTRKRLARRVADFVPRNSQNGQEMHKPGSQNRKK